MKVKDINPDDVKVLKKPSDGPEEIDINHNDLVVEKPSDGPENTKRSGSRKSSRESSWGTCATPTATYQTSCVQGGSIPA